MTILVAIYSPFACWCIPEAQVEALRREFPEHVFIRADSDAETLARIPDADVVFGAAITPDQLAAARRLRWIHSNAAGVGHMLFPEMVASPVVMSNSRGNSAATIAEHVAAVTLALLRQLPLAWRRQAEGAWSQDEFNAGASMRLLRGSRMLIVGFGSIGSEVGRLAAALGADVVGIRRTPPAEHRAHPSHPPHLAHLHAELPRADVVVIAAPQTAETVHMISDREFALMKPDAVLVNVSRGKLVDEAALLRALESDRLRGAALDVFEQEPLPPASPLWARPDVLITPHVAGFHPNHWTDAARIFAENLRRFAAGQPLANLVDKKAGY